MAVRSWLSSGLRAYAECVCVGRNGIPPYRLQQLELPESGSHFFHLLVGEGGKGGGNGVLADSQGGKGSL